MRGHRLSAGILAGLSLVVGGCGHHVPQFKVTGIVLTEQTDEGAVLSFTLVGENRNDIPLPLRRASYSLSLDGHEVFRGLRSPQVTIRRFGTQSFTLPVAIDLTEIGGLPTGQVPYRFQGTVEYELPGSFSELLFETEIRRPSASFAESGRLDFSALTDQTVPE